MKKVYAAAIGLMAVSGCSEGGPPIRVNAVDLYAEYLKNAAAADQQYRGHTLIVTGMSGGIDSDGSGYVLTLVPGVRAHLGSETAGANLFQQVSVRCGTVQLNEAVVELAGCEITSEATGGRGNRESANSASQPAMPPKGVSSSPGASKLEAAFEAATGHRTTFAREEEEGLVTVRPLEIVELPFGAALLTEQSINNGCHACLGSIGVFYLTETGGKIRVRRGWPKAVEGSGWGVPPENWKIDLASSRFPTIYSESSYMFHGEAGKTGTWTELRPEGPVISRQVSIE